MPSRLSNRSKAYLYLIGTVAYSVIFRLALREPLLASMSEASSVLRDWAVVLAMLPILIFGSYSVAYLVKSQKEKA
jgi:hypothetical protein